jgi:hypothetical protein
MSMGSAVFGKPPGTGPCRIAQQLGVEIVATPGAAGVRRAPCGEAPVRKTQCCDPSTCPNARLMFDLMFDGVTPPHRSRMH